MHHGASVAASGSVAGAAATLAASGRVGITAANESLRFRPSTLTSAEIHDALAAAHGGRASDRVPPMEALLTICISTRDVEILLAEGSARHARALAEILLAQVDRDDDGADDGDAAGDLVPLMSTTDRATLRAARRRCLKIALAEDAAPAAAPYDDDVALRIVMGAAGDSERLIKLAGSTSARDVWSCIRLEAEVDRTRDAPAEARRPKDFTHPSKLRKVRATATGNPTLADIAALLQLLMSRVKDGVHVKKRDVVCEVYEALRCWLERYGSRSTRHLALVIEACQARCAGLRRIVDGDADGDDPYGIRDALVAVVLPSALTVKDLEASHLSFTSTSTRVTTEMPRPHRDLAAVLLNDVMAVMRALGVETVDHVMPALRRLEDDYAAAAWRV